MGRRGEQEIREGGEEGTGFPRHGIASAGPWGRAPRRGVGQTGQRTGELHRTGSSGPQRGCRDPFLSVFSCVDQASVTFLFKCGASHTSVCPGVELGGGRGGIAY